MISNNNLVNRSGTLKRFKNYVGGSRDDVESNNNSTTNFTSLNSFGQGLSSSTLVSPSFQLYSLALPDSIRSFDTLSPLLFSWIHSGYFSPTIGKLRVYSPAGDALNQDQGLPPHLTNLQSAETLAKVAMTEELILKPNYSQQSFTSTTSPSFPTSYTQPRKPVPAAPINKVFRFFISIMEIEVKSSFAELVCILSSCGLKRSTSCIPVTSNGKSLVAQCMEGFLFDVPRGQGDIILSLHLYSANRNGANKPPIKSSPSISSFTSFTLKRSNTITSTNTDEGLTGERTPATGSEIGSFISDLTLVVPSNHPFSKVDAWHGLMVGKKQIGRVRIQMGLVADTAYVPIPDAPQDIVGFEAFLDFYLLTRGGLIWDRKCVEACSTGLMIRSANSNVLQGYIPYTHLLRMRVPDFSELATGNGLVLTVKTPWNDPETNQIYVPTVIGSGWKDEAIDACIHENNGVVDIFVKTSKPAFEQWHNVLRCHIQRYHGQANGAN